jgi:hypothetical protein
VASIFKVIGSAALIGANGGNIAIRMKRKTKT